MPIPSSDIETPEVVLASPGEMLEQTRDRLESPNIENKWRAFVVVQDDVPVQIVQWKIHRLLESCPKYSRHFWSASTRASTSSVSL